MSKILKTNNLLLEIGCEEIPARFMPGFLEELKIKTGEKLKRERLSFAKIETLGTARRLVLYVENLASKQDDLTEEVKGPPADRAFDPSGQPAPAAIGFAKAQGVTVEELIVRPFGANNYVFAKITRKGQATEKILSALLPEIISSLYQPLSMRWGNLEFKFIRPLHSFLALYGNKVIKFNLAGITSANYTFGHRYLTAAKSAGLVAAADLAKFKTQLAKLGVIVDQTERKGLIKQQVLALAKKAGLDAASDNSLLDEVSFLVENPLSYLGSFREEFLKIPQDVLVTSMKKNQKYFPLLDGKGKLQAKFIVVTDGCKNAQVVEGNEKVLSARLADARFFYEEDRKTPLKLRTAELAKVSFFEKLGTLQHKSERLGLLAEWLGRQLGQDNSVILTCRRIAELCKADLTTKMVFEFPELQGVMGREYALLSGEDHHVANGIFEHYLPRFADDIIPGSVEGSILALADRIDSIIGALASGHVPTGSEDPYGLRRAAHGMIRIILEKNITLPLDKLIEETYKLYEPVFLGYLFNKGETSYQNFPSIKKNALDFFLGRLRPLLLERGLRYDVVDAAFYNFSDILETVKKAAALSELVNEKWFPGVVASADRLSRLAGNTLSEKVEETLLQDKEEKELYSLYLKVKEEVSEKLKAKNWGAATRALATLTDPIETFFNKVLVMHEDENLKMNRLALLKSLDSLYLSVADFKKIVVNK